jgi:N-acetylneuraminic acid mutarotase
MRLYFNYTDIKTVISLTVHPTDKSENLKLSAKISDYFGNALANMPIEFFDSNRLIGSAMSNEEGIAELEYTVETEDHPTIIAKFAGKERYRAGSSPLTIGEWSIAADMPTPRDEVRAAAIGSRIYVIGGFEVSTTSSSNIVEVYDTRTNTWSKAKELPFGLDHAGVASYQGKLYVVGGFRGGLIPSDFLLIFDPLTDEWTRGADMPTARGALITEFIDGILYAVGGLSLASLDVNEAYDPRTNTWTTKAPMPTPRDHLASAVANGKLYVIGGRQGNTLTNLDVNEEYDPIMDEWTTKAPMPTSRGGLTAALLSDGIYVTCGETPSKLFSANEQYIPSLDMWIVRQELPTARHGCASAEVEGKIYIIGGSQNTGLSVYAPSNKNEVFTPVDWKTLIENVKP